MIDVRSELVDVNDERRQYPRLEFHCTALFSHSQKVLNVTDFSRNGVFVEIENKAGLEPGRVVSLAIKFPTEDKAILTSAKIANVNNRGVGCHLFNLSEMNDDAIRRCFETFRDTLPIS